MPYNYGMSSLLPSLQAPVSKRCAIVLDHVTIITLDDIFDMLKKVYWVSYKQLAIAQGGYQSTWYIFLLQKAYPEVHLVRKIGYTYSAVSKSGYVIIIQDWCSEGSLRDYQHDKV